MNTCRKFASYCWIMQTWFDLLTICSVLFFISCDENGQSTGSIPSNGIVNPGFEILNSTKDSPAGWEIHGTKSAVNVVKGSFNGNYELYYHSATAYSVSTVQLITTLENGYYDLEFYFRNSGGQASCYVSAGTTDAPKITSLPVTASNWEKAIVKGIQVEDGTCTITIHSNAAAGNWSRYDDFKLVRADKSYTLLKGGDVSLLTYLERKGAKFFENGVQKDCFTILQNNGFNIVRLRLYNDPGNPDFSPSNRLPPGIQNPTDILQLAKRAKNAEMQLLLTFHYSDYWTNAGTQHKPHEWENLSYEDLKKAVYTFTKEYMLQLSQQGTLPEYVSLGNETGSGILFPEGSYEQFNQMAELFNQGYKAVKEVSPDTKILIHLPDAGNIGLYEWYFDELIRHGAQFDMIGSSYYPFWTQKTTRQMREWADQLASKYNRDIFILETGYNWNPTLPSGYPGQLSNNGPYVTVYPSSPLGQKNFLLDLFCELKKARNGKIVGCLYWDPIMIEVPGVGWELGGNNVVSNTTLFDFQGNALEAFDAFNYNN